MAPALGERTMFLGTWLRDPKAHWRRTIGRLFRDTSTAPAVRGARRVRLQLQPLEDRTVPSGTELVNNGGFETGNFSGWTQAGHPGFTFVTRNLPHSGNFAADLGPVGSDGSLAQNLSTVAGAQYTISWWLASDGGAPSDFSVYWDGHLLASETNIPAQPYVQSSYTVTASSNVTTIQFFFRDDPAFLHLDDVSVQGVAPTTNRATTVAVSPTANALAEGGTTPVTVTVTDTDIGPPSSPTGTITLSTSSGLVTLSAGSVQLTPSGTPGVSTGTVTVTGLDEPGGTLTATYTGDGTHSGSSGSASLTVTDVPPSNLLLTLTGTTITEGGTVTLAGSFQDPGPLDTHTVVIDWGDGSSASTFPLGPGVLSFSPVSHQYLDNPAGQPHGTFAIQVHVTDDDGSSATGSMAVEVDNVAPTVGTISAPVTPVIVGSVVSASASFSDPGVRDTHTAVWDWGDGTTSAGTVTEANGSGSVSGGHAYSAAGVYTLMLTVTDNNGGSGQSVFQYAVVYDPSAGYVTGSGWITSPAGAYAANPSLTGKAAFGFVAKYQKGANVPTGNTAFQFQVANFSFQSTSYDWLVVAGAKAQYKGTGTVNGAGNYGFLLTAIDGALPGGGGQDKFRLKIWDKTTGTVIYDNQMGGADTADPTTVLGGGSIIIHSGN
jgi:hypothetical protein